MSRILQDAEIAALLAERKPLPANWRARLSVKAKANQAFRQREFDVKGDGGHEFHIILRRNELNLLDFSLVLKLVDADGADYILVRFNGRHPSQHTNKWEKLKKLPNAAFPIYIERQSATRWTGSRLTGMLNRPTITIRLIRRWRSSLRMRRWSCPQGVIRQDRRCGKVRRRASHGHG